jgi:Middle or third domain of peptidase_M16
MDDGEGTILNDIAFISKSMAVHPPDEVLSGDFLMTKADHAVIKQFLDEMINAHNMIILVGDKEYEAGITISGM